MMGKYYKTNKTKKVSLEIKVLKAIRILKMRAKDYLFVNF